MKMESYENNTKTTKEGKTVPLKLPLNIESGKEIAEGGESNVWEIHTRSDEGSDADHLVLKISKDETFATEEEMQKAEDFYKFLKNFPGFGKFVPDTIYFKAQETEEDAPKAFCIQQFKKGERIDRVKDDVIYKDGDVIRQLLELIDASLKVIQEVRKNDGQYPDFMRTPELNSDVRVMLGGSVLNPRYSSNILVTDKPDKSGQRIWFVDAGVNANARRQKGWEWEKRHAVGSVIEMQFNRWKRKLEKVLVNL
jgi:hypothetical protein